MSQRGSIRKRSNTWTAYWSVTTAEGERRQASKGGFRTRREAAAYLTEQLALVARGAWLEPTRLTVGQFLRDTWLPGLDLRPSGASRDW
jgi:Arm DNA-binding domain